ncbi:ABC transporter permease [Curtobacterium sp. USHLN213]|uniref:ABC transporter permease n=1 Tax=Curtobacterium sp. USHLN213 TaxID=3081255 RepID=UPI00301880C8
MTAAAPVTRGRAGRRPVRGAAAARTALITPGVLLLVLCALLPLLAIVVIGFTSGDGGVTFDNFSKAITSATYLRLLWRTVWIAVLVTVLSIAIGWPAAWALARYVQPRTRSLVLGLVVIPYITSQLLLIYGYMTLVQPGGPVSSIAALFGGDDQTSFLYTPTATLLMLVYESLPTAVLVMYSASERVNGSLLEAARTLGAGRLHAFTTVIWPLCSGMLLVNFSLTFVQTVGAFAEPQVLGGPNGNMLGNAISEQLGTGSGEPFAVALSLLLLVASLIVVGIAALVLGIGNRARKPRVTPAAETVAAATVSSTLDPALQEGTR